ncbi:hypothetical protein F0562_000829 [Nyssa sinensis]|uniref:soluble epoxide hydrolase n=1 Tax=Nyssa sinensis TaxID=561372 RepID=A0A5J5C167_9ASTE|nr:hypothetical protein F0562_000829 [Nyssa sinensis]
MEKIAHRNISVNGISMHVAEIGEGPPVLFLHGFPELWYSWRHQMLYLSSMGYRAIAPDLRGYGDTDAPASASSYSTLHIVGDLVALLDALALDQVFLVAHDWGAIIAWYFCLFRPDRIKALVNTSVAFQLWNPSIKPLQALRETFGDAYYMCRFQEPGEAEEGFAQADTAKVMKTFFSSRNPSALCLPKGKELGAIFENPLLTVPSWLTEEDVNYYASKFNQTGFTGGLNYYRALDLSWELSAPWRGLQIKVPVKFIVGDLDLTYHMPGVKEYIHNGGFKKDVPNLEVVVMEGVAHFLTQEKPEEISAHIYNFIKKF